MEQLAQLTQLRHVGISDSKVVVPSRVVSGLGVGGLGVGVEGQGMETFVGDIYIYFFVFG